MPRWVRNPRLIALVMLSMAALSITIIALAQAQVSTQPRLFMTLAGQAYEINYYNVTMLPAPTVVVHGYVNGTPAPFTVSLFAITPRRIYTVGYYYGVGTVSINLTGAIMSEVATIWLDEYGNNVMPSLMAFITYGSNNETWTVIAAIPYNPSWIIEKKPIEISINAEFNKVRPVHAIPLKGTAVKVSTQSTQAGQVNGSNDPFGFTYVGSCSSSSNIAYPPIPSSTETVTYYWVLEQCSEFEGGIPLMFVGWGSDLWNIINAEIKISNIGGTAQKDSGLFGVLNESGINVPNGLVLVGPTYTFSNTYTITMPSSITDVFIEYGSLNEEVSSGIIYYTVPGSGFFYIGLPSYVAYVAFQEYEATSFYSEPTGFWANGTETLAPLPTDFSGSYLYVYPYLDVGNGSMTGSFLGIIYVARNYGKMLINLDDAYSTVSSYCGPAPPLTGYSGNQYYIGYSLSSITSAYSPNIIGWAFMIGGLFALAAPEIAEAMGLSQTLLTFIKYLSIGISSALTIAGAFVNTALVNQYNFGLTATVYVYLPSQYTPLYVTFIGSPKVTSTSGSQSLYPMGIIVNSTNYYNMGGLISGLQCNT
ncbi:hypothetical protein [Vulcanisaeta distributa]|nr:hypothetical protein [Vulcanisaeta distributa]